MACRGCLECLLKILNFLLTVAGLGMVGYGIYLLVEWKRASEVEPFPPEVSPASGDHELVMMGRPMLLILSLSTDILDKLPKAWFIYLFIAVGVIFFSDLCCLWPFSPSWWGFIIWVSLISFYLAVILSNIASFSSFMARLILPYRGWAPAKMGFLGLISSVHSLSTNAVCSSLHPVKNIYRNQPNISKEVTCRRRSQFSRPSLRVKQTNRRLICSVATEPVPTQVEERKMDVPKEIFLKDYKEPDYFFDAVDLKFSLGEDKTIVCSKITVSPRVEGVSCPLSLDGRDLKLLSIKVNGTELKKEDFHLDSRHLTLLSPPTGVFSLEIVTEISPQNNTSLEGLYKSSGNFCTQCEAEGFRRITFYQDRPDVMAKYTCQIEADKTLYPVLLSNGNLIEQGDLEGGRHYALWEDPFKKPSYLFALVAGQLVSREDTFVTCSGRKVSLKIWTPAQDLPKTAHAMDSLKAAMKWDEEVFGLEYDLDLFNVVAADFNLGAMENKSLNIFNSKLVLASPETATDADYAAILGVIGHEYFHNWTGNRVTCRNWFQLSLKEGLTVFRDQEFSSDMGSRPVKRIADVSKLRIYQFPQDAGPMAHPVRPHSYIKMDNFYTATVYEKGAEVVRMYKTLLGQSGFRKSKHQNISVWRS